MGSLSVTRPSLFHFTATRDDGDALERGAVGVGEDARQQRAVVVLLEGRGDLLGARRVAQQLAHQLALHIAAMKPLVVSEDQVDDEMVAKEREFARMMGFGEEGSEGSDREAEAYSDSSTSSAASIRTCSSTVRQVSPGCRSASSPPLKCSGTFMWILSFAETRCRSMCMISCL